MPRRLWNAFKNFAIVFSFVVNFILVVVLLFVVRFALTIKNQIAEPMVDGLHSNFVAMDEATINATIPVSANVPVSFPLAIENTRGSVVIAEPTPLNVPATFTFPANGGQIRGMVALTLPQGTVLPVDITVTVPVHTEVPIVLDVPATIPLNQTELHTPFSNLRYLMEPFVFLLDDTPDTWAEALSPSSRAPEEAPPANVTNVED
jgi:hypothetical protein